jgi:hypothetical protein
MPSDQKQRANEPSTNKSESERAHERPDPPVGTDGPSADRKKTIASEDLNSADDE